MRGKGRRATSPERATTRTGTEILFPNNVASGATVWVSACWVSPRGEIGIASTPISFTIQGERPA